MKFLTKLKKRKNVSTYANVAFWFRFTLIVKDLTGHNMHMYTCEEKLVEAVQ